MKRSLYIFVTLVIIINVSNLCYAQDDVRLRAISGGLKRINLAVFDLLNRNEDSGETGTGIEMTSILKNDIKLSGVFSLIPSPKITTLKGLGDSLDYILLDNRGAEYLIKGTYNMKQREVDVTIQLQHVKSRQAIIDDQKYTISSDNIRWGIHKISDDIVYALTGEPGIAQSKIVFVSERTGFKEIFMMDYDGANIEQLTFDRGINLTPRWSPDGRNIVYASMKNNSETMTDLYIIDLPTRKTTVLSQRKGLDMSPAWSPDSKNLAYVMSYTDTQNIYISKSDGSNLRKITNSPFIDISPCFSPSGNEIAFVSRRAGNPQVYIMNSDGTNIRRLTYYGNYNQTPSWSPNGDKIAFINLDTDDDFDIFTIDVAGENIFQLTDFTADNEEPSWSPDGLHIAFHSTRGGLPEIYIMNWDGTDQTRITSGGKNTQPNWSGRLQNRFVR